MARMEFLRSTNKLIFNSYRLTAEIQVIFCLFIWLYITLIMTAVYFGQDLTSSLSLWLLLLLLLNGFLIGPIVATLTAVICGILIFPGIILPVADNSYLSWFFQVTAFLAAALFGGFLQRLILWLNKELHSAQHEYTGTGLPTYKSALAHLERLLSAANPKGKAIDFVNIRLNNLDHLRRTIGTEKTDQLVKMLAERIQDKLGENALISQTSDNELLGLHHPQGKSSHEVQELLRQVLDTDSVIDGKRYKIDASAHLHRNQSAEMASSADRMLQEMVNKALDIQARRSGTVDVSESAGSGQDDIHSLGGLPSSRQIQMAMENNQISLAYIPRLKVSTGYFSTLSAVLCWHHPKRGVLWLKDFRDMLEEESAIHGLSAWAVKLSFSDADDWLSRGYRFSLAIGVTIDDHLNAGVLAYILAGVRQRSKSHGWLAIEVTAKSLITANEKCISYLKEIQHHGVTIIVSEFGCGEATIQEILLSPVDAIKLAPELIDQAMSNSDRRRELGSLMKMIHSRGLSVIADGVKSGEALRLLRDCACDELQGPFLSRALPARDIPWGRIRI